MTNSGQRTVAIIGAGLAGATLADRLSSKGYKVSVFEKSRGTGGRLASCRIGRFSADLGAPWLVSNKPEFINWLEQQELSCWTPETRDFQLNTLSPERVWLATPRQSNLTRDLLNNCQLHTQIQIKTVWPEQVNGRPRLVVRTLNGERVGYFDQVIITTPALQAAPLLEAIPSFSHVATNAVTTPSWVTVFETSPLPSSADVYCGDHPVLYRCVCNSNKPARQGDTEIWTLEACANWSQAHIEAEPERVHQILLNSFSELIGSPISVDNQRTHRWLLARHNNDTERRFLWDPDTGIGACGDWLNYPGLEGSWRSANALADEILAA